MLRTSLKDKPIKEFEPLGELNPKFFRQQRVQGVTSYNRASFKAFRPEPNLMLYSYSFVEWKFTVQKQSVVAGPPVVRTPELFTAEDFIYTKPFAMSNAMSSITLSYNGNSIFYPDPRHWSKYVHMTETLPEMLTGKFDIAGGRFPTHEGAYSIAGLFNGTEDVGLTHSASSAFHEYRNSNAVSSLSDFTFLEPLMVGLHQPYEQKHMLKPKSRYRNLSWSIPHVKQFGLDVVFDRIPANTLNFMYGQKLAGNVGPVELADLPAIQDLTATLNLYWFNPSAGYVIPRMVSIPSWNLKHLQFRVNGGAPVLDATPVSVDTGVITLHQIPNAILIFAQNVKAITNSSDFVCRALNSDSDGAGADADPSLLNSSQELNLAIDSIQIRVDFNNIVVNTDMSKQQLYRLTEQNCNEIPFSFPAWEGGTRRLASTPGATFLYLTPQDLNIPQSSGLPRRNFSMTVVANMTSREGYNFSDDDPFPGGQPDHIYDMHVVYFFDNYLVTFDEGGEVITEYLTLFP